MLPATENNFKTLCKRFFCSSELDVLVDTDVDTLHSEIVECASGMF